MVIRCGMFLFRQFIAMGRLSIALSKGDLYHLDNGQTGLHVTIHLAHQGVFLAGCEYFSTISTEWYFRCSWRMIIIR